MPKEDVEAADIIQATLESEGVKFVLDVESYNKVASDASNVTLTLSSKSIGSTSYTFSALLIAAGRKPNVRYEINQR